MEATDNWENTRNLTGWGKSEKNNKIFHRKLEKMKVPDKTVEKHINK